MDGVFTVKTTWASIWRLSFRHYLSVTDRLRGSQAVVNSSCRRARERYEGREVSTAKEELLLPN